MEKFSPLDLVTHFRFDLVLKYLYAKSMTKNYKTNFFKEMYKKHLELWNGFREYDNPNKCTFEAFDEEFKKIIESMKVDGFNPEISKVPVVEEKYIVNGAHRVAAALALDKEVYVREANMPNDGQKDCSWDSHFSAIKLPEKYANQVAIEYAKLLKDTYVLTLFPSAKGDYQNAISNIKKYGNVIYYRKIDLKDYGPLNLMRELYVGEAWAGGPHDNYHGFRMKEGLCYTTDYPTYVFLIQLPRFEDARGLKNDIRNRHGVGNHSVHINDTHEQTQRLARILFNDNSIHHLNKTKPSHFSKFESCVKRFKSYLEENNLDIDEYAIAGSSPLSIYGLREGEDLDYIHINENKIVDPQDLIHSHNEYGKDLYPLSYDEIILNPEFHFYSMGVKFVTLDIIKRMKEKRNEPKDVTDIQLINSVL
jgi:hypothetical protein